MPSLDVYSMILGRRSHFSVPQFPLPCKKYQFFFLSKAFYISKGKVVQKGHGFLSSNTDKGTFHSQLSSLNIHSQSYVPIASLLSLNTSGSFKVPSESLLSLYAHKHTLGYLEACLLYCCKNIGLKTNRVKAAQSPNMVKVMLV